MIAFIKSEMYRIVRKRGPFLYLSILGIGYVALLIIRSANLSFSNGLSEVQIVFSLLPLLVGTLIFSTVFADELQAKVTPNVIGCGISRSKIIYAKMLIALKCVIVLFWIISTSLFLVYQVFSLDIGYLDLLLEALLPFLKTMGYIALSCAVIFATQKPTLSVVTYVLLSSGFVSGILMLLLNQDFITNILGNIGQYTITNLSVSIFTMASTGNFSFLPCILYLGYFVVFIGIAVATFQKKELEF